MTSASRNSPYRALVAVFEDLQTAQVAAIRLQENGFAAESIELVTHDIHQEAPEVETPKVHETTSTSLIDGATKWASIGAGAGAVVGLLTPFPGAGLGMIVIGGLVGGFVGGLSGVEHASEDESVNLPSLEEYEQLVNDGNCLLVVLGEHDALMQAEKIIDQIHGVRSHLHPVHGHEFHEHPAHRVRKSET